MDSVTAANRAQPGRDDVRASWHRRNAGWLVAAASLVVVSVILIGRWEKPAFADATKVVQAVALRTHSQPVERVYLVDVDRDEFTEAGFTVPRNVRVATQGDRFWVEVNRGEKRWAWGRDRDDAIWLTLGPRRAMRIERDEMGRPLQCIGDIYSLELESLLRDVLRVSRSNTRPIPEQRTSFRQSRVGIGVVG